MAITETGVMNLYDSSVSNFFFKPLPIVLLLISGSVQFPIKQLTSRDLSSSYNQEGKNQKEVFFNGFMMIPKIYSNRSFDKNQSDLISKFKYRTIGREYSDDDINNVVLKNGKSYINNVNEFEMDNLSRQRHDNVSVLQNDGLGNDEVSEQDDLVTWNSAALEENWWSICQLPVFVIIFALVGVLAITFVVPIRGNDSFWERKFRGVIKKGLLTRTVTLFNGPKIPKVLQHNKPQCFCISFNRLPSYKRYINAVESQSFFEVRTVGMGNETFFDFEQEKESLISWLKNQMIQSEKSKKVVVLDGNQIQLSNSTCPCPSPSLSAEDRWICHTVINLKNPSEDNSTPTVSIQPQKVNTLPDLSSNRVEEFERRPETIRIKAKGLLERRGSSASLTIDLPQSGYETKAHVVTPTRECMSEEFLLSAGNVLSRSQLRNCLKNVQRLHQEFWEIPLNHQEKSVVTGCGTKNRYQSILPNEKTRVKLTESEGHPLDAYINANYIRGYDGEEKAYIATQGPLPNTVQDLYRMAWNERSPIIVMITKFYEKAKVKCESYFPTDLNETATYGDYKVTVISVVKKEGFSVRELLIQNDCETRRILHYWYDSWPDHKTPQNAHSIVAMATEIEKYKGSFRNKSFNNNDSQSTSCGPVIVHCSAGIGRTGCFIAISIGICQLLEEDKVDVLGIVCQMRCDRGGMIQTAEQYEFVHRAVALFELSLPDSSPN